MRDRLREEIYRVPRAHEVTVPRSGDLAELVRDHCQSDTGLLVQVVGDPHLAVAYCHKCGQRILERLVEVYTEHEAWRATPGPWFVPIDWLRRIDPRDPVNYPRILRYVPRFATAQELRAANKP